MRVLITGGSGFIGTNLVAAYRAAGDEVLNLDTAAPKDRTALAVWNRVDLIDGAALTRTVRAFRPELALHMAARTDLDGRTVAEYRANTVGVRNLIDALDGLESLQRVIFASSRLVCAIGYQPRRDEDYCPTTAYGESKVAGERIVRQHGARLRCPWVIVRPTSIWGPWFDVPYRTFFTTVQRGRYVHPGRMRIAKSFGFVGNTVHELARLATCDSRIVAGRTIYLADYPPIDVADMAEHIRLAFGAKRIRNVPVEVLRIMARAGDILKRVGWHNPPLTTFRLSNLITPMVHDLETLRTIAGELPYSMIEGINRTVAWMRAQKSSDERQAE